MSNFLKTFPDQQKLLDLYPGVDILEVNAHLHTPYSFSAFDNIAQIFSLATKENIKVAGINDFFVADGYGAFCSEALKHKVFPLFNIEFIGLLKDEQQHNIRINDPNNPGRCYFSGKGLDHPFHLNATNTVRLRQNLAESQKQVAAMVEKSNGWFDRIGAGIKLSFNDIRSSFAKELVRERHIAKAIRVAVFEKVPGEQDRLALLTKICGGKEIRSSLQDVPALENEIRGNLLKAGGKAYVEEDESAFMPVDEIVEIILDAGGIPCYPVLLDDIKGNYTEYEKDPGLLWKELSKRNTGCIELIPGRNDADHLQRFVEFFNDKNFIILFGTEHNTPELIPLTCNTRGKKPLNDFLRKVSYEGACVVAAHQYLRANSQEGFVDQRGRPANDRKDYFIRLGNAVIRHMLK
ncbi:MAG: hypothetical protein JXB19_03495 [Bacteroidales bacterium]|nr:hypothetical protein [Bacteroidales bacterium]